MNETTSVQNQAVRERIIEIRKVMLTSQLVQGCVVWLVIVLGFVGVLIIIRPGGVAFEWAHTDRLELLFEVGGLAFEESGEPDHAFFNGTD